MKIIDAMVRSIRHFALELIDDDFLQKYPIISEVYTADAIQDFSKIALLRATLFCQQSFLETRIPELVDASRRILNVSDFDELWDSLTEFQNEHFRPDQILLMAQKYNMSPQFAVCSMCAEWMFRLLTLNDVEVDSAYALDRLTNRILSFQMSL